MALEYRHEFKYVVSRIEIACLRSRIQSIMELDSHTGDKNVYQIRSLYFDDYKNTCFYENEEGTSPREKFRIRIYDSSPEVIHLELKQKNRGKTHKDSCTLTKGECDAILNGRLRWKAAALVLPGDETGGAETGGAETGGAEAKQRAVLHKFFLQQETRRLEPKVIVEYEREPYVYRNGNVRVTFDTDIRSSSAKNRFFEERIPARPVMPVGYHLMEVKYDEFLPDHIYRALQLENLRLSTFSKYYLCRKYNMGGINNYGIQ